jgi:mono/diheme cytochrome c family protein
MRKSIPRELVRLTFGVLVAGLCLTCTPAPSTVAQSNDRAKEPRVDYWQPLWMQRELWGPGEMPPGMRVRLLRHFTFVHYGVSREYQRARSTVGETAEAIEAGRKLYAERCAVCHGSKGLGDGDAANSLLPPPALLAVMMQRPISVDEYLLWSIAEGAKQFETRMPAFKDTLSRREVWEIVAYMRAGFPDAGGRSSTSK